MQKVKHIISEVKDLREDISIGLDNEVSNVIERLLKIEKQLEQLFIDRVVVAKQTLCKARGHNSSVEKWGYCLTCKGEHKH